MNQKEEIKFADSNILEGMTSISALLNSEAENDRRIVRVLVDSSKRRSKASEIGFLVAKSHELGFAIEFVDAKEIEEITIGTSHGGIVALCTERTLPTLTADRIAPDGFNAFQLCKDQYISLTSTSR